MECPGQHRTTCRTPKHFSGDRILMAFSEAGAVRENDSFEKIPKPPCCSMRFRERFGALIRKGSWCRVIEEKRFAVSRLHLLLSTICTRPMLPAFDRSNIFFSAFCARTNTYGGLCALKMNLKLSDCHIRIQISMEVRCKLTKEIPMCVYLR